MEITRTYKLAMCPNSIKEDTIRYTYEKNLWYVNMWVGKLFFNGNKDFSTRCLGKLANQAQRTAKGIISALLASAKATSNKTNIPVVKQIGCPARIEKSKDSSFDYWASVSNQWEKYKRIYFPVKSHHKLNDSLRNGWILNPSCNVIQDKNGKFYLLVYVQKEVNKALPPKDLLGCDVGYTNSVSRSDGYVGHNLSRVIARQKEIRSQHQRQHIKSVSTKNRVKQILDKEVKLAIARCKKLGIGLAVENPKVIANLSSGWLQDWARTYFAHRCEILAKEQEVWYWQVNPAYTSITCSSCGHIDKESRFGISFICTACGYVANADINAARNIKTKGTVSLERVFSKQ